MLYRPPREDEADLADAVANTVNEITALDPRDDILVFLPGEREIREAMDELAQRALPHTVVLPLYARLSAAEQQRVFQTHARSGASCSRPTSPRRRSRSPASSTSSTPGVARVNRYNPRTGVTQLLVEPISQASADQRKGRCGRTASGVCFRLYEEQDYDARPAHTDPEIKRVGLAGVILRMKALGLGDIEELPVPRSAAASARSTRATACSRSSARSTRTARLTRDRRAARRLPVDPRIGRMILGGRDEGALREVLVIAAALGLQDPRERPHAAQQKADEAHRKFRDEGSDFAGSSSSGRSGRRRARAARSRQLHKLCRENFLSYLRMREWEDIHAAARPRDARARASRPTTQPASGRADPPRAPPGLLSKIGMWNPEPRDLLGARQTRFQIHPSSGLAQQAAAVGDGRRARRDVAALRAHGREDRSGVARAGRRAAVQAQLRRPALGAEAGAGRWPRSR